MHHFLFISYLSVAVSSNGVVPMMSARKWVAIWDWSRKNTAAHSKLQCPAEHISLTYWQASEFILPSIHLHSTGKHFFMVKEKDVLLWLSFHDERLSAMSL